MFRLSLKRLRTILRACHLTFGTLRISVWQHAKLRKLLAKGGQVSVATAWNRHRAIALAVPLYLAWVVGHAYLISGAGR